VRVSSRSKNATFFGVLGRVSNFGFAELVKGANSPPEIAKQVAENLLEQAKPRSNGRGAVAVATINGEAAKVPQLGFTYGELLEMDIPPRKEVIFGLGAGEIGLMNAINNVGKTTLLRNLAISLCTGGEFAPFTNSANPKLETLPNTPKKVAFFDLEDTRTFMRSDFQRMLSNFSDVHRDLVNSNLLLVCEYLDAHGEEFSFSNPIHMALAIEKLAEWSPDLILVDTISTGFQIQNENDNAQVRQHIMAPLRRLARAAISGCLATHHIGKPRGEEGDVREASFRGRGASSLADMSRLILNLEKDSIDDTVILTCAKVKGKAFVDTKFRLS